MLQGTEQAVQRVETSSLGYIMAKDPGSHSLSCYIALWQRDSSQFAHCLECSGSTLSLHLKGLAVRRRIAKKGVFYD